MGYQPGGTSYRPPQRSTIFGAQDSQHLADLRNLCDHKKSREPTDLEVKDLIAGVTAIVKSDSTRTANNAIKTDSKKRRSLSR